MNSISIAALSEDELEELDHFLLSEATADETMMLDVLDGYLTALVIGPVEVPVSRWLPGVWGPSAEHAPAFDSAAQAQRVQELIVRHMKGIVETIQEDPDGFEPLINSMTYANDPRDYLDGEMWAQGFMSAVKLCRDDWQPLLADAAGSQALRPIYLLGSDEASEEEAGLAHSPAQREELSQKISASVGAIYRFWLQRKAATSRNGGAPHP